MNSGLNQSLEHAEALARANRTLQNMVGQKAGALREAEGKIAALEEEVQDLKTLCASLEEERDLMKEDRDMHRRLYDSSESQSMELSNKISDLWDQIDEKDKKLKGG